MKVAIPRMKNSISSEIIHFLSEYPLIDDIYMVNQGEEFPEADLVILPGGEQMEELDKSRKLACAYHAVHPNSYVIYSLQNETEIEKCFFDEVNLLGVLLKPFNGDVLRRYLEKITNSKARDHLLQLTVKGNNFAIKADDIIYIESDNHTIRIMSVDGNEYTAYEKISDVKKRLPRTFIQCHKSYLINRKQIKKIHKNQITMINDRVLPISRSRSATIAGCMNQ